MCQSLYGKNYENVIRKILINLGENPSETAGCSDLPDITIDGGISFEIKSGNSTEAGQKKVVIVNNKLDFNNQILWNGKIPSFLHGDKTKETWEKEKYMFEGIYIDINNKKIISDYYKNKGSSYIQIEHIGLFHTGDDVLKLNVPLFEAETKWRIRCKQHSGSSVPNSITASLIFNRKTIMKSNKNLEWWDNNKLR